MNILLVCAAGMSTSLLVTKMEKARRNKEKNIKSGRCQAIQSTSILIKRTYCCLGLKSVICFRS